jgi:hypothetical protein
VYNRVNTLAPHSQVNHGSKQYVSGTIHTNTIEGFWALVKGGTTDNVITILKNIPINISARLFLSIITEIKAARKFLIEY